MKTYFLSVILAIAIILGAFAMDINITSAAIMDVFKIPTINCLNDNSGSDCAELPKLKYDIKDLTASRSFSSSDIMGTLKAIATLAINLFIVIVNTVVSILKGILPFLK